MRLFTEQVEDIQVITEEVNGKKQLFIEGIFLQGNIKNRNGRVYPMNVLSKEVGRYMRESVDRKNAFGELGHPQGPTINPERISHLITSLKESGSNYIGKAKILSTPMGDIVRNIMEDGGKLAVSSRGLGSLKQVGDAMHVQEDFMLATAADVVINPSAPDAFVSGILEQREYFWENSLLKARDLEAVRSDLNKAKLNEQQILDAWTKLFGNLSK